MQSCEVRILGFTFDKYKNILDKGHKQNRYPLTVDGCGWQNWVHDIYFTQRQVYLMLHFSGYNNKKFTIYFHRYNDKQYVDNIVPINTITQDMALENPKF